MENTNIIILGGHGSSGKRISESLLDLANTSATKSRYLMIKLHGIKINF